MLVSKPETSLSAGQRQNEQNFVLGRGIIVILFHYLYLIWHSYIYKEEQKIVYSVGQLGNDLSV